MKTKPEESVTILVFSILSAKERAKYRRLSPTKKDPVFLVIEKVDSGENRKALSVAAKLLGCTHFRSDGFDFVGFAYDSYERLHWEITRAMMGPP